MTRAVKFLEVSTGPINRSASRKPPGCFLFYLINLRPYWTSVTTPLTLTPHMGSHYPRFSTANRKTRSSTQNLTENFPRCQDPCLEAPPTGLPPLVQLQ
ncbi:hypothetical protein TNCV_3521171 [Trichonephila clavipes]|nr:hypothetical protein TNCV_3521171 [Trichonephila clavipes]